MTLHFPDEVDTNVLTIDATDPKSGTAEFKAAAIRVEKIVPEGSEEVGRVEEPAAASRNAVAVRRPQP
jgi:formate dehydrogenase major subunit